MKNVVFTLRLLLLAALAAIPARAADVTDYDSDGSLATNVTKNYLFTDPSHGLSVVVAVTMTPYSASNASPVFTLLDYYNGSPYPAHLGIDSGLGGGDGNWVDFFEGVNFTASLVSASDGIITNSIQFGVIGLGLRPGSGTMNLIWTSSACTNVFSAPNDGLDALDTNMAALAGTTYAGQLRFTNSTDGQYQLDDNGPLAGQSVVFRATFAVGNGAPVQDVNPSAAAVCLGNAGLFTATAIGYPNPTVQWQVETNGSGSFVNLPGETNTTLTLTPSLSDNGNEYQALFTNGAGSVTSSVATLLVGLPPSPPVIALPFLFVAPESTNSASVSAGAGSYVWSISGGTITSAADGSTITYIAGVTGSVMLTLIISNLYGCTADSSTNIPVIGPLPGVSGGDGIYVTDNNNIIEKFDTNGLGSLYAATGNGPTGVAFDSMGNLYEANYNDGTVVEMATNGMTTMLATNVGGPEALAFDGAGNLYVADANNNIIWKIATNGVSPAFFNNGLNAPDGLAFDQAGNLYVANYDDNTIEEFTANGSSSIFTTNVNGPAGMAFDGAGNLYVADYNDSLIWKLESNGLGSIFASNSLSGPQGLVFDSAGNLYAANYANVTVAEFKFGGGVSILSQTNMIGPQAVAVWPLPPQLIPTNIVHFPSTANAPGSDVLYVTSSIGSVEEFGTNGLGTTFASGLGGEQGATLDSAGHLYVVDQQDNLIEKYDTNGLGSVFATNLNNPIGLAIDALNNVYVNNFNDSSILKFTPNGAGSVFGYGAGNLQGMAFDGAGYLYVAEYDENEIIKFDYHGVSSIFAGQNINGPQGLAFDAAGNLYVANNNINTIEEYSPDGTDLGVFAQTEAGPYGAAFDSAGNLYVTTSSGMIQKITPQGVVAPFANDHDGPAYLAIWPGLKPRAIATTPLFASFFLTSNQFQFAITGTPSVKYIVQATTNLAPAHWVALATNAAPFLFAQSNAASFKQQFYRAVAAP